MSSTLIAVVITAIPSVLAGIAAIITAVHNKRSGMDELKADVKSVKTEIYNCRKDISITKEASFYALQAHVENGVNGDVKKAHTRLKKNVFDK